LPVPNTLAHGSATQMKNPSPLPEMGSSSDSKPEVIRYCVASCRLIAPGRLRLAALLPAEGHAESKQTQSKQAQLTWFRYRQRHIGLARRIHEVGEQIKVRAVRKRWICEERYREQLTGSRQSRRTVIRSQARGDTGALKLGAAIRPPEGDDELESKLARRVASDVVHPQAPVIVARIYPQYLRTRQKIELISVVERADAAGITMGAKRRRRGRKGGIRSRWIEDHPRRESARRRDGKSKGC